MVAKSYQNLEILDEPHASSGRPAMYVTVRLNNGKTKEVRWYNDDEYAKMYPEEGKRRVFKTQKQVLGFDNGYVTIFKGNAGEDNEWFMLSDARYCKWWGWYFISTIDLPYDLPGDVTPIRLPWELVGKDDGYLRPDAEVRSAVDSILYDETGRYVGEVGDRIEVTVIVKKNIAVEGYYGLSHIHIMYDDEANCYVWTTTARNWAEKTIHKIRGTIKEHKTYKGEKQTILTRCSEVS